MPAGQEELGDAPRRRASHPGTRGSLSRDHRGAGAPPSGALRGPLHVEVTDGTAASNRRYRENLFYDLAKTAPIRIAFGLGEELAEYGGAAVAVTPGFMRYEQMLAHFGVSEENWRDAVAQEPAFAIAESPHYLARPVREAGWATTRAGGPATGTAAEPAGANVQARAKRPPASLAGSPPLSDRPGRRP